MDKKIEKKIYMCGNCGVSLTNRADWCDLGCGRDYSEMIEVKGLQDLLTQQREEAKQEVIDMVNGYKGFDEWYFGGDSKNMREWKNGLVKHLTQQSLDKEDK